MKYFFTFLFLIVISIEVYSQSFRWANHAAGDGYEEALSIAVDRLGNTYVTGQIEYSTDFGNGIVLTSHGIHDIFVAKYDPSGNILWAVNQGGSGGDKGYGIAVDDSGNAYVTGEFEETAYFGNDILVGNSENSMFIAKYNSQGEVVWETKGGGPSDNTKGYAITYDPAGYLYVAGGFQSDASFGSVTLHTAGNYDVYLAKCDLNGNFIWAKSAGGSGVDRAFGISTDQAGRIFIAGTFEDNIDFNYHSQLQSYGDADAFVACYDTSGNFAWAQHAGNNDDDEANAVTADGNGNVIVCGYFNGTANFGSSTINSSGNEDAFIASYDRQGNLNWVKRCGGLENDEARGVATDLSGNVYVTGDFADTANFSSGITKSSNGFSDVFVASFNPSGTFRYVKSAGGNANDRGRAIAVSDVDEIYFSGEFSDNFIIGNQTFQNQLLSDLFVSHISSITTSVNSLTSSEVKIFPVPASKELNIFVNKISDYNGATVELHDLTGKLLLQQIINPDNIKVDIENIDNGYYYISLINKKELIFRETISIIHSNHY